MRGVRWCAVRSHIHTRPYLVVKNRAIKKWNMKITRNCCFYKYVIRIRCVAVPFAHAQRSGGEQINPNGWRMTCETQTTITATPTPVYDLLPMEGQQMIKTESRSQATHAATAFECVLSSVRCLVPNAECRMPNVINAQCKQFLFFAFGLEKFVAGRPPGPDQPPNVSSGECERESEWTHEAATADFRTNGISFNLHFFGNYES